MTAARETVPRHVALLGYGGLLPFVGLAVLAFADSARAPAWSDTLTGYGAVILSFVGAVHWGIAMSAARLDPAQRRRAFVWSVVPALLAWPATVLAGVWASSILVLGFVLQLVQDLRLAGPAGLPAWYLPMRWRLTLVACGCLAVHAWHAALGG